VNWLCDGVTVVAIKVVHAAFSNPSRLPLLLPLEPSANATCIFGQYFEIFRETVNSLLNAHPPSEICRSICDNLSVQVAGLHSFLEIRAEDVSRIMHIPHLNHMLNLVVRYGIRTDPFANVVRHLLQVIHALNTPPGIEIVGRRCPAIIHTR
jgi:hypothetical protein